MGMPVEGRGYSGGLTGRNRGNDLAVARVAFAEGPVHHTAGRRRSCCEMARATLPRAMQPLSRDDLEYPPPIPDRVKVAFAEDARALMARYLIDP